METYYDKFNSHINSIKNDLFKLNQKRNSLLQQLESDYTNGLISEVDYKRVKQSSILDLLPGYLQKYSLTSEEIAFIKENGKVVDGGLSLELINDYLQAKLELIKSICNSVIEGENIYNMNPTELRQYLKSSTVLYYNQKIQECDTVIEERRTKLGDRAIYDVAYGTASRQKAELESKKMSTIDYIDTVKDEDLYQYAYRTHKVNGTYYEWYKSKQSEKEQQGRKSYNRASSSISIAKTDALNLSSNYIAIRQSDNSIDLFISDYLKFMSEINVESILEKTGIKLKNYIFTPKQKRIRETYVNMQKVFAFILQQYILLKSYMSDVYGAPKYINEYNQIVYDIEPTRAFDVYIKNQYSTIDNITVVDFIEDLISNLTRYANAKHKRLLNQRRIEEIQYEVQSNNLIASIINTEESLNQGELLQNNYSTPKNITLPRTYISPEEEQEMFENLEQVLIEQSELRKRNNYFRLSLK